MIIRLKGISEENFLFKVSVNASLKFTCVLQGLSDATQALQYLEGTRSVLANLRQSGTQALRALTHLGTQGT